MFGISKIKSFEFFEVKFNEWSGLVNRVVDIFGKLFNLFINLFIFIIYLFVYLFVYSIYLTILFTELYYFMLVGGLVLWIINLCRLFKAKSISYVNNQFYFKQLV